MVDRCKPVVTPPSTPSRDQVICPLGLSTHGQDGMLQCSKCAGGNGTLDGFSECVDCNEKLGLAAIRTPSGACSLCGVGSQQNAEQNGCVNCEAGKASPKGTKCEACATGQYSSLSAELCVTCEAGFADADSDAGTPCETCSTGRYSGVKEVDCHGCRPGAALGVTTTKWTPPPSPFR